MKMITPLFVELAEKLRDNNQIETQQQFFLVDRYPVKEQKIILNNDEVLAIVTGTAKGNIFVVRDSEDGDMYHLCIPPGFVLPFHLQKNLMGAILWVLKGADLTGIRF